MNWSNVVKRLFRTEFNVEWIPFPHYYEARAQLSRIFYSRITYIENYTNIFSIIYGIRGMFQYNLASRLFWIESWTIFHNIRKIYKHLCSNNLWKRKMRTIFLKIYARIIFRW